MYKEKIKVAYILTPISFGGSERVSLNFLKHIDHNFYKVQPILLLRPWEEEPYFARELRSYGFRYESIPTRKGAGKKDPIRIFRVAYKIYSILRRSKYDLIHTHGYYADICALPVAWLMGIQCISTCHGFISNDKKLGFYNTLDRRILRLCDKVICVSESIQDSLLASGLKPNKISVIPNAVDFIQERNKKEGSRQTIRKRFCAEDDHLVLGYAGRLSEEKGLKYLIQAFEKVVPMKPQSRLWLIGDGPLVHKLQEMVISKGLEEHIAFLGFREDIEDIMKGIDIFILPSLTEGTPLALLEAMSFGIPTIASSVGQIPQIIKSGENGVLITPGDVQAMTRNILMISEDKKLAKRLSEKAIKTVGDEYSITSWTKKIEDIYYNVATKQ